MVVFAEVPDEISLAISIAGCPCRCPACHSQHLWDNDGTPLDDTELDNLLAANAGITCVAFMGGDAEPAAVAALADRVKAKGLKTCWYSGRGLEDDMKWAHHYDYLKTGPYIEGRGPIDIPTTNQRFFVVIPIWEGTSLMLADITYKFQKRTP